MRIHSFSRILAFPFIIVAGIILYFLFFKDREDLYPYLLPLAVILATIYAFYPKIDYWWHLKQPPVISSKIKTLLFNGSPFFRKLDEESQGKFLDRMGIFMHHKAFYLMRKEKESMPEDMKALIAICAVTLTFYEEDWYYDQYDYFIAYQHPFPTPNKQFLHSVEINHDDGVVLFNADYLFQSMILGNGVFNLGLYAFAEVYLTLFPDSELSRYNTTKLAATNELEIKRLDEIVEQIGFREINVKAVLIARYFESTGEIDRIYPAFFELCESAFSNPNK